MKYAVDRIENNIVVLENLETREIIEENINNFDEVEEKDIFTYVDNHFIKDESLKTTREQLIREKLDKLKRL